MDAKLSRRTLLKWLGVSATTTALAACVMPQARQGADPPLPKPQLKSVGPDMAPIPTL